jgi:NAD(P)-dependent dehydrogenase (short-subunit alcohol dehydrogenase family)
MTEAAPRAALVVGAGTADGIGRAIVRRLLPDYRVTIWDRTLEGAAPEGVEFAAVDVTDWDRLGTLAVALPPLSLAVNCVATATIDPAAQLTKEQWDKVVAVNLSGAFYLARWLHRPLAAANGVLVNISSVFAANTFPNRLSYTVTKAGLTTMTRCLAAEWAPDGIRVVTVTPGITATGAQLRAINLGAKDIDRLLERTAQRRLVDPSEVADVVCQVAQPGFSAVTGSEIVVDAGYNILGGGFWDLDTIAGDDAGRPS